MPTKPRNTDTITFSLPPEMAQQLRQVVKEEDRTVSELLAGGHPPLHGGAGVAQTGAAGTAALPPDRTEQEDTRRRD